MAFGLEKPVFRILVNTMGTLGAIGFTTGLMPSLTLGPGGIGGAITGDNISVNHLMNIKRLAYEVTTPPAEIFGAPGVEKRLFEAISSTAPETQPAPGPALEEIVREVLAEILGK